MCSVQWWQRLYSDPLSPAHNVREVGIPVPSHLHTHTVTMPTSLRRNHNFSEGKLQALFVDHKTFKEAETFVEESSLRYIYTHARLLGYNYAIA